MQTRSAGTMIRTIALTVFFGFGVATGVAMGAMASSTSPAPCTTDARGQQAAPTKAADQSSTWAPPPSPSRPGGGPY